MKTRMPLASFLTAYLRKIGIKHVFGIPGDLVISLFMEIGRARDISVVTLSHEPSVAFSADGYARSTGGVGVLCVTYGAGGFNVINPVAGAYAERVPLLVISGGPGEEEYRPGTLIHHQARTIESQLKVFREVTCVARVISDSRTAAEQIDDVVRQIWENRQPGYIEIHRDMARRVVPVPKRLIEWGGQLPRPRSDARKLSEAVEEAVVWLNRARRPVVLLGIEPYRFGAKRDLIRLVERLGCACCATVLAKGAFPMDHPQYMGVYAGPLSAKAIRARVRRADLVLSLGTLLTDIELGSGPPEIPRGRSIWTVGDQVRIRYHTYNGISPRDFIQALLKRDLRPHPERVKYSDHLPRGPGPQDSPLKMVTVLKILNAFLARQSRIVAVVDSGDSLFGGIEIKVPSDSLYMAQGFYASMGFSVPAGIGAAVGTGLRPLVICGDGAFQMTGGEISHCPRLGLNPIVIVLNNGGWGIFRPVARVKRLLELPDWRYADLANLWGGMGVRVSTAAALEKALDEAAAERRFVLIEALVDPRDLSPLSKKYIQESTRRARRLS